MAARIEVLSGPDKGWNYTIVGAEARVGRGAGNQVRLTDPTWPDGTIRVQVRQGGYIVANELPYAVFLDGVSLPPDGVRTLHHGATLQPTSSTLLRLEIVDAPTGPATDGAVVADRRRATRRLIGLRKYLPSVVLIGALAFYGFSQLSFARPGGVAVYEAGHGHKQTLLALTNDPECSKVRSELSRSHELLADAVYEESVPRPKSAHQHYRKLRDTLAAAKKGIPSEGDASTKIDTVARFVDARLKATATR